MIDPEVWNAAVDDHLRVLSDSNFQQRVWLRGEGPEVSSWCEEAEDFECMLNPGGFMDTHWRWLGLSEAQYDALKRFELLFLAYQPPQGAYNHGAILADPAWAAIRVAAGATRELVFLQTRRDGTGANRGP